jgi:hypothetical protein
MGTSAFDSATLEDREFEGTVVNDNQALLRLDPTVSQHATLSNAELKLSINNLNENAQFTFNRLFRIHNDGADTVDVSIVVGDNPGGSVSRVFGTGGPNVPDSSDMVSNPVTLEPGEYVDVGAELDIGNGTGTFDGTFTVNAN